LLHFEGRNAGLLLLYQLFQLLQFRSKLGVLIARPSSGAHIALSIAPGFGGASGSGNRNDCKKHSA
jgi:hypothetical protein